VILVFVSGEGAAFVSSAVEVAVFSGGIWSAGCGNHARVNSDFQVFVLLPFTY
jgi:hypothetical protein